MVFFDDAVTCIRLVIVHEQPFCVYVVKSNTLAAIANMGQQQTQGTQGTTTTNEQDDKNTFM